MRLLACLFFSFFAQFSLSISVSDVAGGSGEYLIHEMAYILDEDNRLSAGDVALIQSPQLIPLQRFILPKPGTPTWFKFSVENDSSEAVELMLSFDHFGINEVLLFDSQNLKDPLFHTGLDLPAANRPTQFGPLTLPLKLTANSQTVYLLRVHSYITAYFFPVIADNKGYTQRIFQQAKINYNSFGILLGICLFLLLVTSMSGSFKENSIYISYLSLHVCIQLLLNFDLELVLDIGPLFTSIYLTLLALLSPSFVQLIRQFFNSSELTPKLDQISKYYIKAHILLLPILIFSTFSNYALMIISSTGIISAILVTAYCFYLMHKKIPYAAFVGLTFSAYTLGIMSTAMFAHALLPLTFAGIYAYEILTCYLAFIFAVVIVKRMKDDADEKNQLSIQATLANDMSEAKSNFLAVMSHEIRTPINGVLGMSDILATTELSDEQRGYNNMVISSGQNLLRILNDILDFSKMDAGKMSIDAQPFFLPTLLADVYTLFQPQAYKKGIYLVIDINPDADLHLIGDKGRIQQVLNNLISNAIKFTVQGNVTLTATAEQLADNHVNLYIDISDTGIGIDQDGIDHLFSPFTQADSSISRRFGGTGLGLSISHKLLDLMGGAISVSSVLGQGSNFCTYLPLPIDKKTQDNYQQKKQRLQGKQLVLVEGIEKYQHIFADLLRDAGVVVNIVNSIAAAQQQLNAQDILLVNGRSLDKLQSAGLNNLLEQHPNSIYITYDPMLTQEKVILPSHCITPVMPITTDSLFQALYQVCQLTVTDHPLMIAPQKIQLSGLTVLVAEDNAVNAKVIQSMLKQLSINVLLVENGLTATQIYQEKCASIDLILMDCEMPVMNGFDATEAIRDFEEQQQLIPCPIIAVTAHIVESFQMRCYQSGMNDVLHKPISLTRLSQSLHENINHSLKKTLVT